MTHKVQDRIKEEIKKISPKFNNHTAKIIREGDWLFLDPCTSEGKRWLQDMADKRLWVAISLAQAVEEGFTNDAQATE